MHAPTRTARRTVIAVVARWVQPLLSVLVVVHALQGSGAAASDALDGAETAVLPAISVAAETVAVVVCLIAIALRSTRWRARPPRVVSPSWVIPLDVGLLLAADVMGHARRGVPAAVVRLAIGGGLVIEESRRRRFAARFVDVDGADDDESRVLAALFPPVAKHSTRAFDAGRRVDLRRGDARLSARLDAVTSGVRRRVLEAGLRRDAEPRVRTFLATLGIVAATISLGAGLVAAGDRVVAAWPAMVFIVAILAAAVTVVIVVEVQPLTESGASLRDGIRALAAFLALPIGEQGRELDRSSIAASASGTASGTGNELVTVLETLLPYSVILGIERATAGALAEARGTAALAVWFRGEGHFSAEGFARALGAGPTPWRSSKRAI